MKILFNPQRNDNLLLYEFENETITATYNGQTEVFDFFDMPNGVVGNVETELPVNPIMKAERVEGELCVELLYYHGVNANQDELFPKWKEVAEDGTLRAEESENDVQDNGTDTTGEGTTTEGTTGE